MTALRFNTRRRPMSTLPDEVADTASGEARWVTDAPGAARSRTVRAPAAGETGMRLRYGPPARPAPDSRGGGLPRVRGIGNALPPPYTPPLGWQGPGGGVERPASAAAPAGASRRSLSMPALWAGSRRGGPAPAAPRSAYDRKPPASRPICMGLFFVMLLFVLSGCATSVPADALRLSPEALEHRQLQTRRFEGMTENEILAASAGVLQDLGFNLDESETELGLLVASKQRSARDARQVAAALLIEVFIGWEMETDERQRIRASLVSRPTGDAGRDGEGAGFYVRITFQRMVWDSANEVSRIERLDEPELYQGFFDRLSKSVFLEAHKI